MYKPDMKVNELHVYKAKMSSEAYINIAVR